MPLDGTEFFDNQTLAKLRQVEQLLATEDQWCKGALRDRKGRLCLVGAIAVADGRRELTKPILQAAREVGRHHYWRIQSFNDDPITTHRDVLRVIDRARAMILADLARCGQPGWQQKLKDAIAKTFPTIGAEESAQLYELAAAQVRAPAAIRAGLDCRGVDAGR